MPEAGDYSCARFNELAVDCGEPVDLVAFDIDGADDFAIQKNGHDHLRSRAAQRCQITRVAAHIVGDNRRSGPHRCAVQPLLDGKSGKRWRGRPTPPDDRDLAGADIVDADPAMLPMLANCFRDTPRFSSTRGVTPNDLTKLVGYFFDQRINTPQLSVSRRYSAGALSIE